MDVQTPTAPAAGMARFNRLRALGVLAALACWGLAAGLWLHFGGLPEATRALFFDAHATQLSRLLAISPYFLGLVTTCLGGMMLGYSRKWTGRRRFDGFPVFALLSGGVLAGIYMFWMPFVG